MPDTLDPTFVLALVLESDASKRRLGLLHATLLLGLSLSAQTVVSRSGFDYEHRFAEHEHQTARVDWKLC